jgi:hypothetical protein
MSYPKQKSYISRSNIISPTDTESIELLLDSIESKLENYLFKDIIKNLPTENNVLINTKLNAISIGDSHNTKYQYIDIDKPIIYDNSGISLGHTISTLVMLQENYNSVI